MIRCLTCFGDSFLVHSHTANLVSRGHALHLAPTFLLVSQTFHSHYFHFHCRFCLPRLASLLLFPSSSLSRCTHGAAYHGVLVVRAEALPLLRVPQLHQLIVAAGEEEGVVRRPRHKRQRFRVAPQHVSAARVRPVVHLPNQGGACLLLYRVAVAVSSCCCIR